MPQLVFKCTLIKTEKTLLYEVSEKKLFSAKFVVNFIHYFVSCLQGRLYVKKDYVTLKVSHPFLFIHFVNFIMMKNFNFMIIYIE